MDKELFPTEDLTPKFSVSEIVWLKEKAGIYPSPEYPSINSPFEIDCKILNCDFDKIANSFVYTVIIGHTGQEKRIGEKYIISRAEKRAIQAETTYKLTDTTYNVPKNTEFVLIGEWVFNEELGIYFHHEYFKTKLIHLFYAVPRTIV